jgi:hypothetical protein
VTCVPGDGIVSSDRHPRGRCAGRGRQTPTASRTPSRDGGRCREQDTNEQVHSVGVRVARRRGDERQPSPAPEPTSEKSMQSVLHTRRRVQPSPRSHLLERRAHGDGVTAGGRVCGPRRDQSDITAGVQPLVNRNRWR